MQPWVGYFLSDNATRFSAFAPDGATNSTAPNESASLAVGTTTSQFVVGTFTATGTTQNLYYYGNGGASAGIGDLAAYSLRAVPEPQTWALAALGASAIIFRLRRRKILKVSRQLNRIAG